MNEKELLIEEAGKRWDDKWFLKTVEHADGDTYVQVHHSVQRVADGVVIRDVMEVGDDGSFEVKRWLIDTNEYITEVKEDE